VLPTLAQPVTVRVALTRDSLHRVVSNLKLCASLSFVGVAARQRQEPGTLGPLTFSESANSPELQFPALCVRLPLSSVFSGAMALEMSLD
jgi:hypothetical protein